MNCPIWVEHKGNALCNECRKLGEYTDARYEHFEQSTQRLCQKHMIEHIGRCGEAILTDEDLMTICGNRALWAYTYNNFTYKRCCEACFAKKMAEPKALQPCRSQRVVVLLPDE